MFGYVNISCSGLNDEDKKRYRAYYCGLCKAIGNRSEFFRLGLSNDLTFLAVVLSATEEKEPDISHGKHCIAHPLTKHDEITGGQVIRFCADMNILLIYYKIIDDVNDEKKLYSKAAMHFMKKTAEKIEQRYKDLSCMIKKDLNELSVLEKENSRSIDDTSEKFADILSLLFSYNVSGNKKKILSWFGFNLGKWIYIIDAYNDLEKDIKHGAYNPLISMKDDEGFSDKIYNMLDLISAAFSNAYELLDVKRNDSIIRNVLYQGIPGRQALIFKKTEEKDGSV